MSSAVVSEMLIRIAADTAQLRSEMEQVKRQVGNGFIDIERMAGSLKNKLVGLFAGLGIAAIAKEFVETADSMALLDARLKNSVGSGKDFANAQNEIYRIAQQNNLSLQEATTLYTKMHEPVKRLGGTTRETGGIVEAFALSLRLGGAATQEAAAATMQFGQAMGSGKLSGDEFRSMAEASPRFMKALAEGMGVPIDQLKKMGTEGKLTADVVGNALMKSLGQLKSEAGNLPDTVAGAFQRIKNDISVAVNELNQNSGLTLGIAGLMEGVRGLIPAIKGELAGAFQSVGDWIEQNKIGVMMIWEQVKGLVKDVWETVKGVTSLAGFLANALHLGELLGATVLGIRMALAGVNDGVEIIGAAFAKVGSMILQTVLAPIQLVLKTSALIAGVFDGQLADKITGISNSIEEFASAGSEHAKKVIADFAAGKSSVGQLAAEVRKSTEATNETAQAQKAAGAAAASTNTAFTALKTGTQQLTEEQKKALETYEKLVKSIKDKIAQTEAENTAGRSLTESEKLSLKIKQDLADGTLKLSKEQKKQVDQLIQSLGVVEREAQQRKATMQLLEQERKLRDELAKAATQQADKYQDLLAKQLEENATANLSKEQLYALETVRLRVAAAALEQKVAQEKLLSICTEETAANREALEALNALIEAREKGVHIQAAKDASEWWKKTAEDIETALTDSLMRGFESGKSMMDSLKDYIKNAFKSMVVKMLVQPIMGGFSAMMPGMANAAGLGGGGGGSNIMSMLSSGQSLWNMASGGFASIGSSVAGGAQSIMNFTGLGTPVAPGIYGPTMTGGNLSISPMANSIGSFGASMAGFGGGMLANNLISGQYSMGGGMKTAQTIATAVAAAINPVLGVVVGAISGLVNRAFGMGPKKTTNTGIEGTFGGAGFSGNTYADWKQKGGWFRSDKKGTDRAAITGDLDELLDSAFNASKDSIVGYAKALGINSEAIENYTQKIHLSLNGLSDAEREAAITEMLSGVSDNMANLALAGSKYAKAGETSTQTLQRLAVSLTAVNALFKPLADNLFEVGLAGGDMASRMIEAAGSLDNLVAGYTPLVDGLQDVNRAFEAADIGALSLASAYAKQTDLVGQLRDSFDGSLESAYALGNAMQQRYQIELELIQQVRTMVEGINTAVGNQKDNFTLDTLNPQEKYDWYDARMEQALDIIKTSTDPQVIGQYAQRFLSDQAAAWNLLTPEQKKLLLPDFTADADMVNGLVGSRGTEIENQIRTDNQDLGESIKTAVVDAIREAFAPVTTSMEESANTPVEVNVNVRVVDGSRETVYIEP